MFPWTSAHPRIGDAIIQGAVYMVGNVLYGSYIEMQLLKKVLIGGEICIEKCNGGPQQYKKAAII